MEENIFNFSKIIYFRLRLRVTQPHTFLLSVLITILERGVADKTFRCLEPRMTANDIIGICVFYFLSREGLSHLFPGERMLGKQMLELHIQQSIELIMAGVRRS